MSKYKITSLHANIGAFNGIIYFLLDNRLLTMEVCTPNFNDYNEFRISNFKMAKDEYQPENNTVALTPYDIADFVIDGDELAYIKKWFTEDYSEIDPANPPKDSPFGYLDPYDSLLVSVHYDTGYRHLINETGSYISKLDCFDRNKAEWKLTSELPSSKLHENKGMYRLLAHISDGIFKNYYNHSASQ